MSQRPLKCVVSIRIFGEEKCFGPGVAELLEMVDEFKSYHRLLQLIPFQPQLQALKPYLSSS